MRQLSGGGVSSLIVDLVYPVGSYFITESSDYNTVAKVQAHFGGTWVQVTERFLYASSSSIGSTAGSSTHTLSVSEMPAHTHTFNADFYIRHGHNAGTDTVRGGTNSTWTENAYSEKWATGFSTGSYSHYPDKVAFSGDTGSKGSGSSFSIMPPYRRVYMYRRTA